MSQPAVHAAVWAAIEINHKIKLFADFRYHLLSSSPSMSSRFLYVSSIYQAYLNFNNTFCKAVSVHPEKMQEKSGLML
jgi:hypothetical protein